MTAQDTPPRPPRGGAAVGVLDDLDPVEAGAVIYFRLWCDGAAAEVASDFALALGDGCPAFEAFVSLCELCRAHARRPLMRHGRACRCLGADEACFANLVATAAFGPREDALMFAMLMLRPDMAPAAVAEAAEVGFALRRMAFAARRADRPSTLH